MSAGTDATPPRLRLLSYNVQTGMDTRSYRHYFTQGWKHVLPHPERQRNLDRIAAMLRGFDLVGLQEVDSGSLRSEFVDQVAYLAQRGGFSYWYQQINRKLGNIAQHSNGLLSQINPVAVSDHKLPGLPGRGGLLARFGEHDESCLAVCVLHLALSRRARGKQLAYIAERLKDYPYVVLMGDMNCVGESRELRQVIQALDLQPPGPPIKTFPSWRPQLQLDHILVSRGLRTENLRALDYPLSDHLPIGMDLILPPHSGIASPAPGLDQLR